MNIPSVIRAGDTVIWTDAPGRDNLGNPIKSGDYALTYYLRTNTASEGATVAGSPSGDGWQFTIPSSTSADFNAGLWFFQAVATSAGQTLTLGSGQLTVERSLAYQGAPGAYDGRSQTQKDLEAVQAAMRAMISGGAVQRYTIGNRELWKMTITDLMTLESKLKADLSREKKAELIANGLGNPHAVFVRF